MAYPETFDALSEPSPSTIRSSTGGISPANTATSLIRSLQQVEHKLGLVPTAVAFTADAGTDTLTSAGHGLANADVVTVSSSGTLPGGLAINTYYFVVGATTNTFQLAATRGGSAIDITSTGSGTHSFIVLFSEDKVLLSGTGSTTSSWSNALNLASGSFVFPQSTSIAPTAEGSAGWDTDDNLLKIGTGSATKTFVDTDSTQTLISKTLTTPTIASFTNATHNHSNAAGGGQLGTSALSDASVTADKLATGAAAAFVTTSEATTSTSFADLSTTTDTVTVTVGANGLVLVSVAGFIVNNGANSSSIGVDVSGANTIAAADDRSLLHIGTSTEGNGASFLYTGLSAGSTVFKMKYKVSAGTGTFQHRRISAVPL